MGRSQRSRGVPGEVDEPAEGSDEDQGESEARPSPIAREPLVHLVPALMGPGQLQTGPEAELDAKDEEVLRKYLRAALSKNTRAAYRIDLGQFEAWCLARGRRVLPASPRTVAAWVAHLAETGMAYSTIQRKLSAISSVHTASKQGSPTRDVEVRAALAGVRHTKGTKQRRVSAAVADLLDKVLEAAPRTFRWRRNRAMLLVAWAGAMRSSELVRVRLEHVTFDPQGRGALILLPFSKTDQEGKGKSKTLIAIGGSLCPVRALRRWIDKAGITSGYVFRRVFSDRRVADPEKMLNRRTVIRLVKDAISATGIDARSFASHSLRAGFVTEAKKRGLSDAQIMAQTGHEKRETLEKYYRPDDPFEGSPLGGLLPRRT